MNRSAAVVVEGPPLLVTTTLTDPATPAGAVADKVVELVTVTEVAAVAPKATVESAPKPEPVTVTTVPPVKGPATGAMEVMAGMTS